MANKFVERIFLIDYTMAYRRDKNDGLKGAKTKSELNLNEKHLDVVSRLE